MWFEWAQKDLKDLFVSQQTHNAIAINIGDKNLYTEPDISHIDLYEPDYFMTDDDVQTVLDILEKHNVMEWNPLYEIPGDGEYEDGYGWLLYIQFTDGTVARFIGAGTDKNLIIPENFYAFVDEMVEFVNTKNDLPLFGNNFIENGLEQFLYERIPT